MNLTLTHWAQLLLPGLLSALFGLIGVVTGGWITSRNQSGERKHRRYQDQLGFYAKLFAIRSVIRAKSELRVRLHSIADRAWREKIEHADEIPQFEEFEKLLEYSNTQMRQELVPLYRQMLDEWTGNMALAEPSTQQHFAALVDYVEIWNRFLDKSLPAEVMNEIGHEEAQLYPLYKDIETNVERLRGELVK